METESVFEKLSSLCRAQTINNIQDIKLYSRQNYSEINYVAMYVYMYIFDNLQYFDGYKASKFTFSVRNIPYDLLEVAQRVTRFN